MSMKHVSKIFVASIYHFPSAIGRKVNKIVGVNQGLVLHGSVSCMSGSVSCMSAALFAAISLVALLLASHAMWALLSLLPMEDDGEIEDFL
jgi:hypothetical protein